MNKKIAIFSPSLAGGGSERVMLNLAFGFAEKGYSVDMVLISANGQYLDKLHHRVRLIDLGARRIVATLPALINYLRENKPAALLSTQVHANVVALIAGLYPGVRTRILVREVTSPLRERARRKTLSTIALTYLSRYLYSRAFRVIAVCDDLKHQIAKERLIPLDKISVIYNPVRADKILEQSQEPAGHDWFDNPLQPILLSIGRLERVKDFASLIRAFALVRQNLEVKLVILGEGNLRGDLVKLTKSLSVSEDIDFPGFVSNPYAYLSRADAVVLSSLWEGLPNVLLEALVLGTPIVATDCDTGPREILRGGKDGILVAKNNAQCLADGIVTCLSTKSRAAAAPASLRRFDFDHVVDQYLDLICT